MLYIVNLVTFIRLFSSIIKNHTKDFRDIGSSDISYKFHIDYSNNYICSVTKSLHGET